MCKCKCVFACMFALLYGGINLRVTVSVCMHVCVCVIKNTYISAIACNVVVLNVSGCEPAHMRVRVYVFLSISVYACECV